MSAFAQQANRWHELVAEALRELESARKCKEDARYIAGQESECIDAEFRRRSQAMIKVKHECVRTAAQLMRGQSILPACAGTAAAQCEQLVLEHSAAQAAELGSAIEEAKAAGASATLVVKERDVRLRLSNLRVGAQPGASGCRIDVIIAMGEVNGGARCLLRWCEMWAAGRVHRVVAQMFLEQILRPIKKDNGKPRNISLMESLYKFASGVVQDAVRRRPAKSAENSSEGLHWSQYGGQPAGPELMLMVHQGLMKLRPQYAYCSLDGQNAYGTMSRARMLRSTSKCCPAHAAFLACQWDTQIFAWVEVSEGSWKQVRIYEGTAQGDTSSTPAFSRGLRIALERAVGRLAADNVWAHLPSLVNDMLLIIEPEFVEKALGVITEELKAANLVLNLDKCAAYIPERSARGLGPDPRITSIPQVEGGLPALGSAYAGDFEAVLGPHAVSAEPARRRLERALTLAKACARYRDEDRPEASLQAAAHVLQRVAAKALAYDVRVLEPNASIPLARKLDKAIAATVKHLLAVTPQDGWTPDTGLQIQWPAELGGMAYGAAELSARIGRIAAFAQCLPVARQHLRAILPTAAGEQIMDAIPLAGAESMLEWLRDTGGIEIGASGQIAREREPRWDIRSDFQPIKGLMGLLTREIQRKQRIDVLERHTAEAKRAEGMASAKRRADPASAQEMREKAAGHYRTCTRLRSAAGDGVDDWVRECHKARELQLNDLEFVYACRWRLGLPVMRAGQCHLHSATKQPSCA